MSGGALSIKTTVPKAGPPKYDDLATDEGFLYRLQGDDPGAYDNVFLLRSADECLPLIYFYGIAPGLYRPLWPVFIERTSDPLSCRVVAGQQSVLAPGSFLADPVMLTAARRYETVLVKKRLHQEAFRHHVLTAYERRCAVCRLPNPRLLEAAHIIPDRDPRGRPAVPNGLALCRLHHGAFDANLLGVRPDYVIEISRELLDEHDGPTLEYGIKGFDGELLTVPRRTSDRPDPDLLEERYEEFRRAG
ncbi:MAG: HNH endonuclease [Sandaracinaceae bacterium]